MIVTTAKLIPQDSSNVTASKTVIFIEDIADRSFVTTL